MKTRIKGAGGLSRKLLTILVLAAMPTLGHAVDNSIYIDQAGDNAIINVTQDGAGNVVRGIQGVGSSNTTPAKMKGDGIGINISQTGAANVLNFGVDTTTAASASPTSINYTVTGGNNTGTINLNNAGTGTNASTTLAITQTGGNNTAGINILGSKNSLTANQSGGSASLTSTVNADNTTQNITTSGGTANSITTSLTGNKGTVGIVLVGASNTFRITQSGGGTNGHSATFNFNGSSNSVTTAQSGTIDTTINVQSVGSGNTFGITTGN